MSNIMAAIGRVQLSRLDTEFAPARRALAALYREKLAHLPGIALLAQDPDSDIIPHIMVVRVLNGKKDAIKAALAAKGFPTGMHYKPNHLLSLYGGGKLSLPVTEQLYSELVTLPLHPNVTPEDVQSICAALADALNA